MLVTVYQWTRHNITGDFNHHQHHCEYLKSYDKSHLAFVQDILLVVLSFLLILLHHYQDAFYIFLSLLWNYFKG